MPLSKILAASLQESGNNATYPVRAWVNANGVGTVSIRNSGNISSLTDNGTGDYTLNFTNNMPDANFAMVITSSGAGTGQLVGIDATNVPTQYAQNVRAIFGRTGSSPFTVYDILYLSVSILR